MNRFFMVFVEGTGGCKIKHLYEHEARDEAKRLARLKENLGKKVFILEPTSFCQTIEPPVEWVELKTE